MLAHGGDIVLSSEVGHGSTFILLFFLPQESGAPCSLIPHLPPRHVPVPSRWRSLLRLLQVPSVPSLYVQ